MSCKYCEFQKWDFHHLNANIIDDSDYATLYMGRAHIKDADEKKIQIFTIDENNGIVGFYPNYCPFCGKQINT